MSAHAVLPFIHLNDYTSEIVSTLQNLDLSKASNNLIHGELFRVQVLIQTLIDNESYSELQLTVENLYKFYIDFKEI